MSADNWTRCPRCDKKHREKVEAAEQAIADAYGKVSIVEFDQLRQDAEQLKSDYKYSRSDFEHSLREDYEIGTDDEGSGVLTVHYRAACRECKFSFKYDDEINMLTGAHRA